ncbi:MAG: putative TPR repeat methyltransferase [Ascidiaceihabitans sp.]|jgi:predicted TPR repeat methyltransferase
MTDALFWDKIATKYAKDPITDMDAYIKTRDRIREILQPHHRVIELGCGTGSTALELADKVDRYIATDVSPKMIDIAQNKQNGDTPAHLSFAVRSATDLSAGPHDVVLALNVLHLLPDLEAVLKQIYQAMPSGGVLIAKTALLKDGAWFLPMVIPVMRAIGKAPFVRTLSGIELLEMLRQTGFSVTETMTQTGIAPRMFTVAHKP